MKQEWYPQNKEDLNQLLENFLSSTNKTSLPQSISINGLIVPHAGYKFSGKIAGKAFSLLKNKEIKKAIILSPSHYEAFYGVASLSKIKTPLGEVSIVDNTYPKLKYEHAIDNQIPFLQKIGIKKVLPLVIGELSKTDSEKIAEEINRLIKNQKEKTVIIASTDLSHFLPYNSAVEIDKRTIEIIENSEIQRWEQIDACGKYPLLILIYLCKKNNWHPRLIEYKNSGDIMPETKYQGVVGYASFYF